MTEQEAQNKNRSIDWLIELSKPKIWKRSFIAWSYLLLAEIQTILALVIYPDVISLAYTFLGGLFFYNWLMDRKHQKDKAMIIASLKFIEFLLIKMQEEGIHIHRGMIDNDEW